MNWVLVLLIAAPPAMIVAAAALWLLAHLHGRYWGISKRRHSIMRTVQELLVFEAIFLGLGTSALIAGLLWRHGL